MVNFSKMRLGKKAPFFHPFTPKFASLLPATLVPPPASMDYTGRVHNWPIMLNDRLGDCAIATVGHLIELYTSYTKPSPVIMTDQEIVSMYSAVGGYNPDDPSTDQGCVISEVLNYWLNQGAQTPSYLDKIAGYARINVNDPCELKYALWWFGGVYIGVNLPKAWQTTTSWSMLPDTSGNNAPGSWGGHAIPVAAYSDAGVTVISWGTEIFMEWEAYHTYCDEAWAVISPDFINQNGVTPANFDWTYLLAAMSHIQQGQPD